MSIIGKLCDFITGFKRKKKRETSDSIHKKALTSLKRKKTKKIKKIDINASEIFQLKERIALLEKKIEDFQKSGIQVSKQDVTSKKKPEIGKDKKALLRLLLDENKKLSNLTK
ncbi:MAG: hypothetical protein HQK77_14830 [Desulfobacterales bacterium]|nr:hypothetical protein [Desulfobacterales bacterium]